MRVNRCTRRNQVEKPVGYYAFANARSTKPIAEGRSIKAVLQRAARKGVTDPYVMEKLPEGVIAFF